MPRARGRRGLADRPPQPRPWAAPPRPGVRDGVKIPAGGGRLPHHWPLPSRGCRQEADALGDHSLSCGIGGERIARHNGVRDAIYQAAQQAGLGPQKEVDGLLPPSVDRPADVFLRGWTTGKDTCLDVTATNALQAATVAGCSEDGDFAVNRAVEAKLRKYGDRCVAQGLAYVPMAVDTFGGWHSTALDTISRLALELARNTGRELGEVRRHLRQRLGVLFLRDNVAMLHARTPSFAPPEVDGAQG